MFGSKKKKNLNPSDNFDIKNDSDAVSKIFDLKFQNFKDRLSVRSMSDNVEVSKILRGVFKKKKEIPNLLFSLENNKS